MFGLFIIFEMLKFCAIMHLFEIVCTPKGTLNEELISLKHINYKGSIRAVRSASRHFCERNIFVGFFFFSVKGCDTKSA